LDSFQELRSILSANAEAPRQLAALFEPLLYLLTLDPNQHAARTLAACGGGIAVAPAATLAPAPAPAPAPAGAGTAGGGGGVGGGSGGGPDLVAYGQEVDRLLAAAADAWATCSNDVRTGGERDGDFGLAVGLGAPLGPFSAVGVALQLRSARYSATLSACGSIGAVWGVVPRIDEDQGWYSVQQSPALEPFRRMGMDSTAVNGEWLQSNPESFKRPSQSLAMPQACTPCGRRASKLSWPRQPRRLRALSSSCCAPRSGRGLGVPLFGL
jgi:hypothetical protein